MLGTLWTGVAKLVEDLSVNADQATPVQEGGTP
jgi:hypothetical protein